MKTRSACTEPVVEAVVLNASARPAASLSACASVAAFPTIGASPGGGGGGGGVAVTVPAAQAESLPSVKAAPLVQVAGIAASPVVALTSELPAPTPAASRKRRVPAGPRIAIQRV